jgi:hypothetical protein
MVGACLAVEEVGCGIAGDDVRLRVAAAVDGAAA